ncbi:MAG: hypothetical protein Q9196_000433 [Gyalolechia fulgens]
MGQESSTPIDENTPTQTLNARTLEAVASYIKEGRARRIVVMVSQGDNKGLLLKLFTQNIDCLERAAGVPDEKIVEAHGSFACQRCIECHREFPDALMKQAISRREVPRCLHSACNGLVKPDIVFFGEALPENFHRNKMLPSSADLAIIMGTSLTVQPFASLPGFCSESVPRVLLNSERVGGLGSRADDVLLLGDCDEEVRKLASALGWLEELEAIFKNYNPNQSFPAQPDDLQGDALDNEIAKVTKEVDSALRISSQHITDMDGSSILEKPKPPRPEESDDKTSVRGQQTAASQAHHTPQGDGSDCAYKMPNRHEVGGEQSERPNEKSLTPNSAGVKASI